MKKILTIAATALLSTIAGAAHAQSTGTVNFPGTVTSSCNISSKADGTFTVAPTALTTNVPATVTVICNGATSLTLSAGTNTIPTQTPAPTVAFGFTTGGTGIFSTVIAGTTTTAVTESTTAAGDTASIFASVTANGGKLLKASLTPYNVAVVATIVPQ